MQVMSWADGALKVGGHHSAVCDSRYQSLLDDFKKPPVVVI